MIEESSRENSGDNCTSNLAQTVPVLYLKKKQIPNIDATSSISPSRCKLRRNVTITKSIDIENPLDRNQIYNRK